MKEVILKIRYEGNKILSMVEAQGLKDDISGKLELIGVLDNMKQIELDKLKTRFYASSNGNLQVDANSGEYDIVNDANSQDAQDLIDSVNVNDYPDEDETDDLELY
ncbi:hypothetical protein M0R04_08775 [Candidatus Dojkabacteria bacterium]|jgi:hypothetical protein|nr:hypothetical protein [Candidatus Dojkabacteria bacterium]